ncbi:MAG TPA: cell wall hydrolase [Croceibacterium sp.]|nr:cell wall hydrolase [Croceibacterium sp.]
MFAAFFGADMAGARAENPAPPSVAAATPADDADGPRFVAEPVVQPLPDGPYPSGKADSLEQLIAMMPEIELSGDMQCLAEAIYFEARGEPIAGQLAVAEVVINRSQSGRYPADYCSVVTQPAQFSFVRRGVIPQPDIASRAWTRAKALAQIAHQQLWETEAGDALFFHATYVSPSWANHKTALARIDTHIFYR